MTVTKLSADLWSPLCRKAGGILLDEEKATPASLAKVGLEARHQGQLPHV